MLLGVDTGGTFTDFVLLDGDRLRVHKVLSTPDAPEMAILQGVRELGLDPVDPGLSLVHGSTVATNAVLEHKGVRTAFISNRGLGDLLTIGRQARRDLYDLQPAAESPPVPPELCLETGGRLAADGSVVDPLTDADLADLRAAIERLGPAAVAINLLFAFLDPSAEEAIAAAMPEGVFVSRSSAVLPEYREYERGIATWLNASVGPLVDGYLHRLRTGLPHASLTVMQSSGGTIGAERAGSEAVNMLLSGPAGGLAAAGHVGAQAGCERLLTFDMGGTSTDVALVAGEPQLTTEGHIGPWPVAVPMVDMHTIGAGGGSIAWLDAGGMLQVGPESAGAAPGPACYGRGGRRPTVTDANLVLGRLLPDAFLGGDMGLDLAAARAAVLALAEPLDLSVEEAAAGIVAVANEHMARALRVVSVQRGEDPRRLTLASFGGAGGLHVCALAEALGMTTALVPVHGGVLSALGMLVAPRARQLSRTVTGPLAELGAQRVDAVASELAEHGRSALAAEGVDVSTMHVEAGVDLRYRGQSHFLNVPWPGDVERAAAAFEARHEERYGHRLELPVELVNIRVGVRGPRGEVAPATPGPVAERAAGRTTVVYGRDEAVAVVARDALAAGQLVDGPAIITETVATTWLAPGWRASVVAGGSLLLERAT